MNVLYCALKGENIEEMDESMSYIDNSAFSIYYVRPREEEIQLSPLSVVMAGDEQCSPAYRIHRSEGEVSVLLYVVSGRGFYREKGEDHLVEAGDVLTLLQGQTQLYWVDRGQPWCIQWFNLTGELYPQWVEAYGLPSLQRGTPSLARLFAQGMALLQGEGNYQDSQSAQDTQDGLCALVYQIVLGLFRGRGEEKSTGQVGPAAGLKHYIDGVVYAGACQEFFIAQGAKAQGLSVRQLERAFFRRFGITPYGYYQKQKLTLAKQYLEYTALTVQEIAGKLGFCDPYYFSNRFKAQEGISPSGYRKSRG